jgi:YidC/Oxa1 family membrane protein insertase
MDPLALVSLIFHVLFVNPMTNVLVALARVFGGNYGVAIIVFTLAMKVITWPLTSSQYKQSRAMQKIQPQMQELQKKYKGKDPKKLQAETMALYKEAGVNPLGCIFPMLAQFPIWIALYQVIRLSLGGSPESLVTLSQRLYPIPYVHEAVPFSSNFLFWDLGKSDGTLILPVLVALSMYVQQKLITPAPTAATTPQSQQQQQTAQMMTWMMPLMFGFWTLNVPAGLGLYWLVSNVSGVVLQYFYMGRQVNWKSMLQFGPPAAPVPAPRVRAERPERVAVAERSLSPKPSQQTVAATESDLNGAADVDADGNANPIVRREREARRKRNGRRRGKR